MARFRSIDPEFWRQPQIAPLDMNTRLLLLGLMSHADDYGRHPANSLIIQGTLFPFGKRMSTDRIEACLGALEAAGEIARYRGADRREYLVLRGWQNGSSWQYQVIQRPSAPRYPEPPEGAMLPTLKRSASESPNGRQKSGKKARSRRTH